MTVREIFHYHRAFHNCCFSGDPGHFQRSRVNKISAVGSCLGVVNVSHLIWKAVCLSLGYFSCATRTLYLWPLESHSNSHIHLAVPVNIKLAIHLRIKINHDVDNLKLFFYRKTFPTTLLPRKSLALVSTSKSSGRKTFARWKNQ